MGSVTNSSFTDSPAKVGGQLKWKWSGILGAREVATSSDLLRRLEARGLSPENARQALVRDFTGANGVWRSEKLRLEGGGRLYAYKAFYGDLPFLEAIRPVLERQRRGIARVMIAIEKFSALDRPAIAKLSAAKVSEDDGNLQKEFAMIREAGLGEIESTAGRTRLVRKKYAGTPESELLASQLAAEAEAERNWLSLLLSHLSCHNIISWKSSESRYREIFNGKLFSATAYSYIKPLIRFNKGDNKTPIACPVVVDVLARGAEVFDIEAFLERIHGAGANKNAGLRIMGVVGAPYFSRTAFDLARNKGLVVISFREIFGKAALEIIDSARSLFTEMQVADDEGPNEHKISRLAKRFSESLAGLKNHPLLSNLSGLAFESFAAAIIRGDGYEDVHTGGKFKQQLQRGDRVREIDVYGHASNRWLLIECKAINREKELSRDDVSYFFTECVPAFLSQMKVNMAHYTAELWTTGIVTKEIRTFLAEDLKTPKGVTVRIRSRDQIEVPQQLRSLRPMLDLLSEV